MRLRLLVLLALALAACGDDTAAPSDAHFLDGASRDASTLSDAATSGDAAQPPSGTLIADYMGVNGFIDDPTDKLAAIGVVREYHNWGWLADNYASGPPYPDMLYTFMDFNGWDWDVFFGDLAAKGSSGWPAVQGGVPWINDNAIPPVDQGADPTAAASYVAHGDTMYQLAARYGAVAVADGKLKLQPDQTRVSGLGTVHFFEDWNEQDLGGFSPAAYAAMASADYDGDQGRLGDGIGVKAADPSAQLVMGGLAGSATATETWAQSITAYLDGMRAWAQAHRGGSFPADVINVHYYSFGPSQSALSPEDDQVEDKLATVVAYRDANLTGKAVWWSEFGYDTDEQSPLHAPTIGASSPEIVQGQWLVRELLAGLAAGVDRATLYVLRDYCRSTDASCHPEIQFATAGVTAVKGDWTPKPAWYFLATVRSRLGTMVYTGERASGNAGVRVASFADTASPGGAFVLWSPTANGTVVDGYALALPSGTTTVTQVALADQMPNGVATTLVPSGGVVAIDVSETPVIVLTDGR